MNNKTQLLSKLIQPLQSKTFKLPENCKTSNKHSHKTSFKSIRQCHYRSKSIRIETTYKIIIDKKATNTHIKVFDDGSVHCHDFPNYSFPSAIDMAKKIVDAEVDFKQPIDVLGMKHGKEGHK